jgi:hypothetical protein
MHPKERILLNGMMRPIYHQFHIFIKSSRRTPQHPPGSSSLHHLEECKELINAAGEIGEALGGTTRLGQDEALQRCLDRLPSLKHRRNDFEEPAPDQEPRPFLQPPKNGWCCKTCGFVTDTESMGKSSHHHEPLCNTQRVQTVATMDSRPVQIQDATCELFPFKGDFLTIEAIVEDAKPDLPSDIFKDDAEISGDNESFQLRTFHFWDL